MMSSPTDYELDDSVDVSSEQDSEILIDDTEEDDDNQVQVWPVLIHRTST